MIRLMMDRPHFFDLTPERLAQQVSDWGMPSFRAKQILQWVYRHNIIDPQAMTNIPAHERDLLSQRLCFLKGSIVHHQQATDGTQKLLVDWSMPMATSDVALPMLSQSDTQTECVMIPAQARRTACISSQIGCPVGCKFCASGLGGLDGNLTTGQIVEQVWQLNQLPQVDRISNVVFMGMGEPLSNFDAVTGALRTLNADWGLGIAARRITVSTVGLPAQIRRLAELEMPITLAISLHAPNDEIRRQIIPWAQFVSMDQLIDAGRFYFDRTGREVTLEYILLGQLNDQPEHAHALAKVAQRLRSHINLIQYNEVAGLPYRRPQTQDVEQFQAILRGHHVNTHIRASRGRDIAAACGQLRHEHADRSAKSQKE